MKRSVLTDRTSGIAYCRGRYSRGLLAAASILTLCGCAKVSVTPLNVDGSKASGEEGLRYYLPKPYLLVMAIPVALKPADTPGTAEVRDRNGNIITPARPGAAAKDTGTPQPSSASAAPASGNTSYQAANDQYVAKLIYLPDYSHPMAISENGWFGTASMNASLTDGWQLTSLQGSSDAKVAETITALASLVSAASGAAGGGAGSAAKSAASKPGGGPNNAVQDVLAPGLYAFNFGASGALINLCVVSSFDPENISTLPKCPENAPTLPNTAAQ